MVIKAMIRSNICMNAHPLGCYKEVLDQIEYVKSKPRISGPRNVLIIGASTGYGLASRIVAAVAAGANTFGISFEREPSAKRTGTSGYYNNKGLVRELRRAGLVAEGINADALSHETKKETVQQIKEHFGKVDLVVYSLASPVRKDPDSERIFSSVLKPIDRTYRTKSINSQTGEISETTIDPASQEEIDGTIKVMGGEDWILWMDALKEGGVLSQDLVTIAYSYIGPEVTQPVYRDGTIGRAKLHLEASASQISKGLQELNGRAIVSVNKALVTKASAVIPVVPLYLALLFKIMKERGTHEGCIEQIYRLFNDRLFGADLKLDSEGRVRMDDWELDDDVQRQITDLWGQVTTENIADLGDLRTYNEDFLRIHGFGRSDIDYEADIDPELTPL